VPSSLSDLAVAVGPWEKPIAIADRDSDRKLFRCRISLSLSVLGFQATRFLKLRTAQ